MTNLTAHFEQDAEMHRDRADYALRALIRDANEALEALGNGAVRQTIGGSVLNSQNFSDAERALVRFWDAKTAAAIVTREG